MNKINYNQTGGFPLDTDILGAMQTAYSVFNHLGSLAGNLAIISGCERVGTSVSDGVVFIGGEILPFKGGQELTNIIVKEESESRVFEDGATKPVIYKKYATFGTSTPNKTYQWSDFKAIFPTTKIKEKHDDFEARLKALENKKSPVPIGLIAIWNKPSTEPIPEGWQECTDLRGRFPLGWNPNDLDFNEIEREGGEKAHRLTIAEMPVINGTLETIEGNSVTDNDIFKTIYRSDAYIAGGRSSFSHRGLRMKFGGDQAHNNMPPYRIIRFIEFKGFD